MSEKTTIPYCDSTFNLMMGCDGCELWRKDFKVCYAGNMVESPFAGKDWPSSFADVKVFPYRMKELFSWSDLRYKVRDSKTWIPSRFPRIVFLNDMGDTFTKQLSIDWLEPFINQMKDLPFVFLLLTKRVRRMAKFFERPDGVPSNFVIGTSVTDQRSAQSRIPELMKINSRMRFLSIEPMVEAIDIEKAYPRRYDRPIDWIIVGGESGARPFQFAWARRIQDYCHRNDVPFFMKQGGGKRSRRERLQDFPEDLRERDFPVLETLVISQPTFW